MAEPGATLRLALLQPPADLPTPKARGDWIEHRAPDLAAAGAALLLLPELFACGYNIGALVRDRAEPPDGPFAARMSALARRHAIAIHYGYAEREGDRIYSAAQCFGPDGTHLTRHRKLVIPPGFEQDHFSPGTGCALFSLGGARIATLICYDVEFAETVRHVALLGAHVVLAPTALGADWGWVARTMIPTRAYENGLFLAYANSAGVENGLSYLGESVIAGPDGHEVARATAEPQELVADLDLDRVAKARKRLPYLVDRQQLGPTCRSSSLRAGAGH